MIADAWDGDLRPVASFPPDERTRANDGKVDPLSRFLIGTMAYDGVSPLGSLYRLEPDGSLCLLRSAVTISNGIGWTADGRTFCRVNTPTGRIEAMGYDADPGAIRPASTFVELEPGAGSPDGLCVDVKGGVWVAPVGRLGREPLRRRRASRHPMFGRHRQSWSPNTTPGHRISYTTAVPLLGHATGGFQLRDCPQRHPPVAWRRT